MKFILSCLIAVIFIFTFSITAQEQIKQSTNYCIVIHGGAGSSIDNLPDSLKNAYRHELSAALTKGENILKAGGTSLDAVEAAVRYMEDSPLFNAGKGAVLNEDGVAEMDAAIMNGKDLSCGAVGAVHFTKNPISLARAVMEKTQHILLVGAGADKFSKESGLEQKSAKYFIVPKSYEDWLKSKSKRGTVGAVALDKSGNLAAATSTGGLAGKMSGRVGDAPLINCGTYANNKTCAVSCTGIGEKFIRNTIAFRVSAQMEYSNKPLKESVDYLLSSVLTAGDGGIIAVDKDGNYVMNYNTQNMFRRVANSSGKFETFP